MDIHLTPDLEKLVQRRLEAGYFNSADEIVRTALFLMEQQEAGFMSDEGESFETRPTKETVHQKITAALISLREGKGLDGDVVFDRLEAEFDALEHAAKA